MENNLDKIHFTQFVKLLYFNAIDNAAFKTEDKESYKKTVIIDFLLSLYSSQDELNAVLDSEIIKCVLEILNFIAADQRYNNLMPIHAFADRMFGSVSPDTLKFILTRYQSMTNFYYKNYSGPRHLGLLAENQSVEIGNTEDKKIEDKKIEDKTEDKKSKRGRPKKSEVINLAPAPAPATMAAFVLDDEIIEDAPPVEANTIEVVKVAKKRGRPPKTAPTS